MNTNYAADHLDNFDLSPRTYNVLIRSSINTLSGVARLTKEEVLGLPHFNADELPALEAVLKENGMTFVAESTGGAPPRKKSDECKDGEAVYQMPAYMQYAGYDLVFADAWLLTEENFALVRKTCAYYDQSFIDIAMHLPHLVWKLREEYADIQDMDEILAMLNALMRDAVVEYIEGEAKWDSDWWCANPEEREEHVPEEELMCTGTFARCGDVTSEELRPSPPMVVVSEDSYDLASPAMKVFVVGEGEGNVSEFEGRLFISDTDFTVDFADADDFSEQSGNEQP